LRYAQALNDTLRSILQSDPRVIILGEDILDPYGGAFKVTRGLSSEFPDRVRTTPVSEGAITGLSAGLALAGFRPVLEIMFGDFLSLCFDQILNHIAKYERMYDGNATCPVIIRSPSGGGRGYGPTHSQSLEKHFLGIPHLRVVAASLFHAPLQSFEDFLRHDSPVLHVEHKLLYPQNLYSIERIQEEGLIVNEEVGAATIPTLSIKPVPRERCAATVVAYGYAAWLAYRSVLQLAYEDEMFVELLVPAELAPVDWEPIARSVEETGSLLTVEEGAAGWSWGTEIASGAVQRCFRDLRQAPSVLASAATIIPSSREREERMLVTQDKIVQAIRQAAA
jgi:pyruvate/2-oxoglutarate/acetoin dehydrogenase E1 component